MGSGFIIAVDGPVASGKGTIAPLLALQLDGFYMNTGALFRMLALLCVQGDLPITKEAILPLLSDNTLDLDGEKVLLNGRDVSARIYMSEISQISSQIASLTEVHENVITREQEIGKEKSAQGEIVIVEGRNIATAVFPDAEMKIFLTASVEKRARRRFVQAQMRQEQGTFEQVLADTKERDQRDKSRTFFPLVSDPEQHGYFVLDTSDMNEELTVHVILDEMKKRNLLV